MEAGKRHSILAVGLSIGLLSGASFNSRLIILTLSIGRNLIACKNSGLARTRVPDICAPHADICVLGLETQ